MDMPRADLGERTDSAAVAALLDLKGLDVVDVGCGPGRVARELMALGATVRGVEPDPIQAEQNRAAPKLPGLTFIEAGAESLPVASASVDGVFFFRSLHHVPVAQMPAALAEAARVLKPDTGFLCVVEPAMTGTHFPLMRPFHDETRVRTAARAALASVTPGLFREARWFGYVQYTRYPDFAALVARVLGQTFNSIDRARVETDEVRALFAAGHDAAAGDYVFEQPMLLDLYRGPAR